ncbi:MAG: helix-turn-helix transcriptional regulator [Selenomonadaceae bacterium]|nr:helix-turn-helix transcriptional regulator [Selenomonadaceae bacterium]MBP3723028.1 helix-turn-helix transcriptional regulator [Selenomonadaceae bacterium]
MKIKFKEFREKRDLSQEEVAKILGVNRAAVAKWETGANNPRLDKLVELAKLLRCTVDDLLGVNSK